MKPDLAIHSSDSNPYYLDFWPLVSRIWKLKFGITPLLVYIDDNHDIPIDETYGIVIKMKPIPDIPKYLQCLWVRYWIPSQYPNKISILSDIDMFPISKRYFLSRILSFPDDVYVHLNPASTFPSCYHIAKGSLFKKVLDLPDKWEDSIRVLEAAAVHGDGHSIPGVDDPMTKWGWDEVYATKKINGIADKSIFRMIPRLPSDSRLDRNEWRCNIEDLRNEMYVDCHSIRPYSEPANKIQIDLLIRIIMEDKPSRLF